MKNKIDSVIGGPRTMLAVGCALLFTVVAATYCSGEITFEKTYGGIADDWGFFAQQTLDGGYIIVGSTQSFGDGGEDAYAVKTDSLGKVTWTRTYGGQNTDCAYCVRQTADGGYVIAGFTDSFGPGSHNAWLFKIGASGEIVWMKTYGGDKYCELQYLIQTTDGGFAMAGRGIREPANTLDQYVVRTDSCGDTLWTRWFGGDGIDIAWSLDETRDQGYILAGWTNSYGIPRTDICLLKVDSLGDQEWVKTYGGPDVDKGRGVKQTPDGGYLVAGDGHPFSGEYVDFYLVRTDSAGNSVCAKNYQLGGLECACCLERTREGDFVIAGYSLQGAGSRLCLLAVDEFGDTLWTRSYGPRRENMGFSVQQTRDGGFIIAGATTYSAGRDYDIYLIKTQSFVKITPKWLKQSVATELDTLKAHSKGMTKKLKEAEKHVQESLTPLLWLDKTHLVCKGGKRVFDEEKHATHEIDKLCKEEKGFPCQVCNRLNGMLVRADSILARVAIVDAKTAKGDPKEIAKAEEEFDRALRESGKGHPDHAIDHFKHAWEHACRAVERDQGDDDDDNNSQLSSMTGGPSLFSLSQNDPNPFAEMTRISFTLPASGCTTLKIYDTTGRLVATLLDDRMEAGVHSVVWNRSDVVSGVYFYTMESGGRSLTKKMTVVR